MTEKMNALRNKKGFTLIEMLVVIAIIAVLVAIVIPVVGSSTDKASAATNAANLRSLQAEVTTLYLSESPESGKIDGANATINVDADGEVTSVVVKDSFPKAKKVGAITGEMSATVEYDDTNNVFVCRYGGATIADFSAVAEGTKEAKDLQATTTVTPDPDDGV